VASEMKKVWGGCLDAAALQRDISGSNGRPWAGAPHVVLLFVVLFFVSLSPEALARCSREARASSVTTLPGRAAGTFSGREAPPAFSVGRRERRRVQHETAHAVARAEEA